MVTSRQARVALRRLEPFCLTLHQQIILWAVPMWTAPDMTPVFWQDDVQPGGRPQARLAIRFWPVHFRKTNTSRQFKPNVQQFGFGPSKISETNACTSEISNSEVSSDLKDFVLQADQMIDAEISAQPAVLAALDLVGGW